ncbi:MFS family permease [Parabacteroides sp. PFB2-12]|uniref:MFS transporter n=1 Tax=unclassified Parabacteroides TaxID=2649774 RepID=UPI0024767EEC|nr:MULTISPECIES: MFS transporter [unclassified Parabacteroides]MDH6342546.1 MFS family permease [Parabacteroides sp. PM6-13]MDH6390198.1 MFS family permease [Parabacteroides sp. PFB2-12]
MASYPKNYPFYNWVPKPLGILILLFLFLPILSIGGVYSVNSGEMMSGLGIVSEHIQFANFVTAIGMAAFAPFFYQLVRIRRQKMMCIFGFSLMYIFSYICAKTDSIFLLALCSLLMGFLRMVLMMVNLFTLIKYAFGMEATRNITPGMEPKDEEGWDNLDKEKSASQPIIYLFFMIFGQLGTSLTAWLAYEYEWQYVYYFMMGLLLFSILIVFITMPYRKFLGRFPINFRKFGNVVAFCITLICITYVLIYGKTLDWYDDPTIRWATAIGILSAGVFLYLDGRRHFPYFLLSVFRLRTIRIGIMLYLMLMIVNSSAMFVNVFTNVGMKIDNYQNATLGNWSIAGYVIGAIISIILGSKNVHFKYRFALGFFIIGLSSLFMYFEVQSAGLYERMKYPVIIRSAGMMILYALTAVYANQRMPFRYLSTWICIMLTVRMILGPGIGTAVYTNLLQERQQHYVTRYAQNVDTINPDASASYSQTLQGMRYQGKSVTEAEHMAALSTKGRIQVQATLSALKEMSGWAIYACLFCMGIVLFMPYPKRRLEA